MYRIFLKDLTFVYTLNSCKVRGEEEKSLLLREKPNNCRLSTSWASTLTSTRAARQKFFLLRCSWHFRSLAFNWTINGQKVRQPERERFKITWMSNNRSFLVQPTQGSLWRLFGWHCKRKMEAVDSSSGAEVYLARSSKASCGSNFWKSVGIKNCGINF